ncbi:MAG: hypothetical protein LCH26_06970 [Proteobacteria bacterium]|nr:hypothetical protein [Pseudomonadota bacterium]
MKTRKIILSLLTLSLVFACHEADALTTEENDHDAIRHKGTSHIAIQMNMPRRSAQGSSIGVPLLIYDNTNIRHYAFSTWHHQVYTQDDNVWSVKITCRDAAFIQKENAFGEIFGGETPLVISFDRQGKISSLDGLSGTAPALFITWHQCALGTSSQTISLDLSHVTSQDTPYKHPRIDYNLSE